MSGDTNIENVEGDVQQDAPEQPAPEQPSEGGQESGSDDE